MTDYEIERELQFLEEHKNANFLVVESGTGKTIAAEYTTCDGRPRTFPVRFNIDGTQENIFFFWKRK